MTRIALLLFIGSSISAYFCGVPSGINLETMQKKGGGAPDYSKGPVTSRPDRSQPFLQVNKLPPYTKYAKLPVHALASAGSTLVATTVKENRLWGKRAGRSGKYLL